MEQRRMNLKTILVTHGEIGEELLHVVEGIVKEKIFVIPISVLHSDHPEIYQQQIQKILEDTPSDAEVLFLSDMCGGTPSNLCLPFLRKGKRELITGVSLPMLLKLATLPASLALSSVIEKLLESGKKHIAYLVDSPQIDPS